MGFVDKLQDRWQLSHRYKVWLVLLVFACTGTTIWAIKPYVLGLFDNTESTIFGILYYIFIFPVYNVVLLIYGAIFGLFDFFWGFEKRMFNKILRRKK